MRRLVKQMRSRSRDSGDAGAAPAIEPWRAQAIAIECALREVQRDSGVRILVSGRPGDDLGGDGPSIVAYDDDDDRLILVDAKAALGLDDPLTLEWLQSLVGVETYVRLGRPWLGAAREPSADYLMRLRESGEERHREAAAYIRQVIDGQREFDAKVIHIHPDAPGVQTYGAGVDIAASTIRAGGGVTDLEIVAVPYPY